MSEIKIPIPNHFSTRYHEFSEALEEVNSSFSVPWFEWCYLEGVGWRWIGLYTGFAHGEEAIENKIRMVE